MVLKSYLSIFNLKFYKKEFFEQIVIIGFNTLPMVILMTTFSGMILSLETADWLDKYGGREGIGFLVSAACVVEIAPLFVSFAIAAQAGTAMTAELAHMQITEQISALRILKVNPINYLVSTRLLATIYVLPLAVISGTFFSIMGGMIVSKFIANLEYSIYLDSVWRALRIEDMINALIKSFYFANYIIGIHTAFGLSTRGGAKEVGKMTSCSTIWTTVGIICINAVLDYFMYLK